MPIKYAIKEFPRDMEQYIIIDGRASASYKWHIIGDSDIGYFDNDNFSGDDIVIIGNEPISPFYFYDSAGDNQFICYGNYKYIYDGVEGHKNVERAFEVRRWEIIYPIKRGYFLISICIPKNYICLYDIYCDKDYTFKEMLKGLYIWNYKSFTPKTIK